MLGDLLRKGEAAFWRLVTVVVVVVGGDGGESAVGASGIGMGAIVEMEMMR